jgi:hypothetical protein
MRMVKALEIYNIICMRHIYITLIALFVSSLSFGQVIWESDFETWTTVNEPDGWRGAKTNMSIDSCSQITDGATFGPYLAELRNQQNGHKRFTTTAIEMEEGVTYNVEVWVRGAGELRTGLFDFDLDGNDFGYDYNSYEDVSSTDVYSFVQTVTPDTTYESCELILSLRNGVVEVDRVEISIGMAVDPVAKTIQEIQETTDPSGDSPELGVLVITSGIVTAVAGNGYYIQDGTGAWSGLRVFDTENEPALGDEVQVTGMVEEYFDNTRVTEISAYAVLGSTAVPAATQQGTFVLNDEMYEGVLVTAEGQCMELLDFGEWSLDDGSGLVLVDDFLYDAMPGVGNVYLVTGPLDYSFGAFKILPRNESDVQIAFGLNELSVLQISAYPNPATDYITIQRESSEAIQVTLIDMMGKEVQSEMITSLLANIDVQTLAAGQYTLRVTNGDIVAGTQVLIQR